MGKSLHNPSGALRQQRVGGRQSSARRLTQGAGRGPARGRDQWGWAGQPEKAEAYCLRAAAETGVRISTFSGAGRRETAGGKTRRQEAPAFFDAKAWDAAAAVFLVPGQERPQTEPPESLRPRASAVPAAVLVAMECPHLSSSVCIAPDSAKFPNGSPSSWCCSGECGPWAGRPRTRGPGSGPGLAVEGPREGGARPPGRLRGAGRARGARGRGAAGAAAAPLFRAARRPGRQRRGPPGPEASTQRQDDAAARTPRLREHKGRSRVRPHVWRDRALVPPWAGQEKLRCAVAALSGLPGARAPSEPSFSGFPQAPGPSSL